MKQRRFHLVALRVAPAAAQAPDGGLAVGDVDGGVLTDTPVTEESAQSQQAIARSLRVGAPASVRRRLRCRQAIHTPFFILICLSSLAAAAEKLPLDRFTYIQVDDSRGKWGDFAPPDWLKYYGLSGFDVNGDGYLDIIAGRYFYLNPGGDMTGRWERVDLGRNVDAMLFIDVDGDGFADCIAEALPDLYWLEAEDRRGQSWKAIKIASLPPARHVNGQGFAVAQIVPGGHPEIVLSTGRGIFYIEIPSDPSAGNWPVTPAAPEASEQGLAVGDIDGDGLIDIAVAHGHRVEPRLVAYWNNPGRPSGSWKLNEVGQTANYSADRIAVADLTGDGRADILVTEESWQTQERVAQLLCFEQKGPRGAPSWERRAILTAGSLNSLDVGDLDHDGDLDLVTCEHKGRDKRLFVLENDGKGRFRHHVIGHGKESHLGTLLLDLDGDGDLDILSVAWDEYRFLHLWRNDARKKMRGGDR
jgi:hypothetical protein